MLEVTHAAPDTCRAWNVSCLTRVVPATCHVQAAELEAMRKGEESRLRAITKEHELLKKEQYKRAQVLFDLRTKERELISEIRCVCMDGGCGLPGHYGVLL